MRNECVITCGQARTGGARTLALQPHGAGNAVNFDPQRRAASPELKAAITGLCAFLEQREEALGLRERRRSASARAGFRLAIEALTCNLGSCLMLGSVPLLAVPRNRGAMWGKARYRPPVYGQHFLDVPDLMAHPQVGFIEDVARGYGFAGGRSQRPLVWLKGRLLEHVRPDLFRWPAVRREEDHEVLVLRGSKDHGTGRAEPIDYTETPETQRLRRQVRRVNAYLRKAPIMLLSDGHRAVETDDGQSIHPPRRTVRRIFNNGSWQEGGRLYGAFWETMRREDRFRLPPAHRVGCSPLPPGWGRRSLASPYAR